MIITCEAKNTLGTSNKHEEKLGLKCTFMFNNTIVVHLQNGLDPYFMSEIQK